MGEKKVTMRQIAKVCGCSLATVSYALNHTGQGKISSATRLRVIDTAKRLNYPTVSPSVIFVLDGGCQAVAHVNPPCVTPMIFVDCDNNDPLYYKILPDYPSLFGQARQKLGREDLFLVAEPVRSGQLMTLLTQGFPPQDVYFHNGQQSLSGFLDAHRGRKGVVVGDLLGVEVSGQFSPQDLAVICSLDTPGLFPPQVTLLPAPNVQKARAAAAAASDLLTLDYDPTQGNRILVGADFSVNG